MPVPYESPEALNMAYVTCADAEQAQRIGAQLVSERLAACVNILPGMISLYRWEGRVEQAQEVVLLAKTTTQNTAALIERVKSLHSYDIPCIVLLPIGGGNPDYLQWLRDACRIESDQSRP